MIEAEALRKRFGSTQALDGLDLRSQPGPILGVLGPNGAGKTTALRVLTTLSRPDRDPRGSPARRRRASRAVPALDRRHRPGRDRRRGAERPPEPRDDRPARAGWPRASRARRAVELLARFELTDAADRR